jgi:hypothetical protein
MERNEGVVVSGGSLTAGQVVAGRGARASATFSGNVGGLHQVGRDEVARALDNLVAELRRHAAELPDGEELLDSTRAVGEELAKEQPNRRTVTAILKAIGEGAGSVTSVVGAAQALAAAVTAIV